MKQDNVFRFIAIRPAVAVADDSNTRIVEKAIATTLLDKIEDAKRREYKKHDEAKKLVSQAVVASSDFVGNSNEWHSLTQEFDAIRSLIGQMRNKLEPDSNLFVSGALKSVQNVLGVEFDGIKDCVESSQYRSLKNMIWHSYYALVLDPEFSPSTREQTAFGLKFLALFESASHKDVFAAMIRRLAKIRPEVPKEFVLPETDGRRTEDNTSDQAKQPPSIDARAPLKQSIEELSSARDTLLSLQRSRTVEQQAKVERLDSFHNQGMTKPQWTIPDATTKGTDAPHGKGESFPQSSPNEKARPIPQPKSVSTGPPPWRLLATDVPDLKARFGAVEILGPDLDLPTIPELVHAIEKHIAVAKAKLVRESSLSAVTAHGRTWVKQRRMSEET